MRQSRPPRRDKGVRDLIRRMSRENSIWGAPRINGELLKLGIEVGETSSARSEGASSCVAFNVMQ